MSHDLIDNVIAYGLDRLQQALPATSPPPPADPWKPYEDVLSPHNPRPPEKALTSIFSLVSLPDGAPQPVTSSWYSPVLLALDKKVLFPTDRPNVTWSGATLHRHLTDEWSQVKEDNPAKRFEIFYHLYRKYAWAVPCTYGEVGVSLFEQWKAVVALAFATGSAWRAGPAAEFSLIGGDIPGIQDFVYTITSKGAAKGLRGRSFFIQLLGDAVVRRILADLDLSPANVIYSAGGNFMILGPGGVTDRMQSLQKDVDSALLNHYAGDLSLCLACTSVSAAQLASNEFAVPVSRDVKRSIADQKRRRFYQVAKEGWHVLFAAQGKPGNRYCAICQRPLARDEGVLFEPGAAAVGAESVSLRCSACDGFQKLAERIGQEGLLTVGYTRPERKGKGESWQEALWNVAKVWYDYGPLNQLDPPAGSYFYTINDTKFLADYAHGFRFIANATPRVTEEDVKRWEKKHEPDEERPVAGSIRTFSQMADAAKGAHLLGVLRMDVDNLGQIMIKGLPIRTMAATSALSAALDLFFTGWLNMICAAVNKQHNGHGELGDRLYVIYAGGDDLFAVGAWDLMAILAHEIQRQFADYTGTNSSLHLSAGIVLEGRTFPLYQAAEHAGEAEERAKSHHRNTIVKDSICFLGLPFKWDEWPSISALAAQLAQHVSSETVPRSLIQVLQDIYAQYEQSITATHKRRKESHQPLPDEPAYHVYYGPWMWRRVYALTRMAGRTENKQAKALLEQLKNDSMSQLSIRQIGLAARWAELLTRKEDME